MKDTLKTFFVFLGKALSVGTNGNAKPSSMRMMSFFVLVCFTFALTFVLIWETVTNDADVVTLSALYMGTVLGVLGIKKWQNDTEQKTTTQQTEQPK
jgi:hypothetical protein